MGACHFLFRLIIAIYCLIIILVFPFFTTLPPRMKPPGSDKTPRERMHAPVHKKLESNDIPKEIEEFSSNVSVAIDSTEATVTATSTETTTDESTSTFSTTDYCEENPSTAVETTVTTTLVSTTTSEPTGRKTTLKRNWIREKFRHNHQIYNFTSFEIPNTPETIFAARRYARPFDRATTNLFRLKKLFRNLSPPDFSLTVRYDFTLMGSYEEPDGAELKIVPLKSPFFNSTKTQLKKLFSNIVFSPYLNVTNSTRATNVSLDASSEMIYHKWSHNPLPFTPIKGPNRTIGAFRSFPSKDSFQMGGLFENWFDQLDNSSFGSLDQIVTYAKNSNPKAEAIVSMSPLQILRSLGLALHHVIFYGVMIFMGILSFGFYSHNTEFCLCPQVMEVFLFVYTILTIITIIVVIVYLHILTIILQQNIKEMSPDGGYFLYPFSEMLLLFFLILDLAVVLCGKDMV